MNKAIEAVAAKVVDEAGQAGGSDEVKRIAEGGWPQSQPIEVADLDSRKYEDHDDCLSVAAADVASRLGLETWECLAAWGDPGRDRIIVSTSAVDLRKAIQARAAEVVAEV